MLAIAEQAYKTDTGRQRTANEEEGGEEKGVGVDNPQEVGAGGGYCFLDGRQGDVEGGAVNKGHAGSEYSGE